MAPQSRFTRDTSGDNGMSIQASAMLHSVLNCGCMRHNVTSLLIAAASRHLQASHIEHGR